MNTANRNTLWGEIFVDELARQGLRAVCVAPGSRSTPLTLAFAASEHITTYSHIDERGAAYFALGMALATDEPVALVCTSGTAVANLFPAIVEANYSKVPIVVLTGDRPHELRESGSNQTIDQTKIYGDHVRWSVDVAPPEANPDERTLRYLRTLAARAMATAGGMPAGPVHLNFPFRKPLEPTEVPGDIRDRLRDATSVEMNGRAAGQPFSRFTRGTLTPPDTVIDELAKFIEDAPRGVIVCGPRCPGGDFPERVTRLASLTGYPVFADALSGVRFGPHLEEGDGLILGGYEATLRDEITSAWDAPQLVLQFGAMPTSKSLQDFLNRSNTARRILVTGSGRWADDSHRLSDVLWADPALTCRLLAERLEQNGVERSDEAWAKVFIHAERTYWELLDDYLADNYSEGAILGDVAEMMPSDATLFVASSLPVRHLDQFARPRAESLNVFANRGASGIDGTISTALGIGAASEGPLVLVTGDLAFYHDMNGLLALQRHGLKTTIIVINNDGGGIFHRLPIAQFDPPFTELFVTPHGLDFEPVATTFGADFVRASSQSDLRHALQAALQADNSHVIEFPSDAAAYETQRKAIAETVTSRLAAAHVQVMQPDERH